jgi:hypothetical protein
MNCETCRNAILAAERTAQPGADARDHLTGCAACQAFAGKAARLDDLLTRLPAPHAFRAKAKLIATLKDSQLAVPGSKVPLYRKLLWNPIPGVAVLVVLGVGGFFYLSKKAPQPEVAQKPRHELLSKEMANVVKLAKADSAPDRLAVWTEWATDLRGETRDLYKVAQADELGSLARMYDKAVAEGIVRQAKLLPRHMDIEEKQKLLKTADAKLAEAAAEAERLLAEAPPQAQKPLKQIVETSREGRKQLEPIMRGV